MRRALGRDGEVCRAMERSTRVARSTSKMRLSRAPGFPNPPRDGEAARDVDRLGAGGGGGERERACSRSKRVRRERSARERCPLALPDPEAPKAEGVIVVVTVGLDGGVGEEDRLGPPSGSGDGASAMIDERESGLVRGAVIAASEVVRGGGEVGCCMQIMRESS